MGAIFLAAFSPENAKWPEQSGYTEKASVKQPIGPTQVLAFVIRRLVEKQTNPDSVPDDQDIQQSWLLREFLYILQTGDIQR